MSNSKTKRSVPSVSGRGQVVKLKKRSSEDEWLEKLHLDIATDCSRRLDELKLAFPFASRRAIAAYVLQLALRQGVFPKGLTLNLPDRARSSKERC